MHGCYLHNIEIITGSEEAICTSNIDTDARIHGFGTGKTSVYAFEISARIYATK